MTTWPTNAWYVATWDAEVDQALLARTICGLPMVFYRKLDRSVVALRDACPQRTLPLSLGIREGDSLRRKYDALKLGSDGKTEEMSIRSDPVNHKICAETYDHDGAIGQKEIVEAEPETETVGDRAYVRRWMPGSRDAAVLAQGAEAGGPDGSLAELRIQTACGGDDRRRRGLGRHRCKPGTPRSGACGMVVDFMTSESETSPHYFWGNARNFDIADMGFTARFKRQQGGVFEEARAIQEAQQQAILANRDLKLSTYRIDEGCVRAHQMSARGIAAGCQNAEGMA